MVVMLSILTILQTNKHITMSYVWIWNELKTFHVKGIYLQWVLWLIFVLCLNHSDSRQLSILIADSVISITLYALQLNCIFLKRSPRVIQYRSYKNFVDELFINDLLVLSQTMMYCNHNVDICIEFFITHLIDMIDKHAPMKFKMVRQNNVPYMNSELRKLNYQRNMMRNKKNKHPCPENFERYRVLRNKCVKAKLKSQREYFAERCDGGPKNQHFWPTIKPFINSKCHVQENIILREKDDIVNDAKSVAKIFNEYFTGIASDIGFNDPIPDDYGKDEVLISLIAKYDNHPSIIAIQSAVLEHGTFEFEQVDINQIYQILVNMNDKKATGYDGIPCKLLKLGAFPLAGILCKLINISFSECKFPDVLKLAEISALFKKNRQVM